MDIAENIGIDPSILAYLRRLLPIAAVSGYITFGKTVLQGGLRLRTLQILPHLRQGFRTRERHRPRRGRIGPGKLDELFEYA